MKPISKDKGAHTAPPSDGGSLRGTKLERFKPLMVSYWDRISETNSDEDVAENTQRIRHAQLNMKAQRYRTCLQERKRSWETLSTHLALPLAMSEPDPHLPRRPWPQKTAGLTKEIIAAIVRTPALTSSKVYFG